MKDISSLTADKLREAAQLKEHIARLEARLSYILGSGSSAPKAKGMMSAAGRARIVAAQKARWAKQKGKSVSKPGNGRKRTMSAKARARIAAAAKARWAMAKAAGRKSL